MTLHIESEEAAAMAEALAALTGESLDEAVTASVRQRLERERRIHERSAKLGAWLETIRPHFDTRPVTKAEYDALCEDDVV